MKATPDLSPRRPPPQGTSPPPRPFPYCRSRGPEGGPVDQIRLETRIASRSLRLSYPTLPATIAPPFSVSHKSGVDRTCPRYPPGPWSSPAHLCRRAPCRLPAVEGLSWPFAVSPPGHRRGTAVGPVSGIHKWSEREVALRDTYENVSTARPINTICYSSDTALDIASKLVDIPCIQIEC